MWLVLYSLILQTRKSLFRCAQTKLWANNRYPECSKESDRLYILLCNFLLSACYILLHLADRPQAHSNVTLTASCCWCSFIQIQLSMTQKGKEVPRTLTRIVSMFPSSTAMFEKMKKHKDLSKEIHHDNGDKASGVNELKSSYS